MNPTLRLALRPCARRIVLAAWATAQFAAPLAGADIPTTAGYARMSQPKADPPAGTEAEACDPAEEKKVKLHVFNRTWPDVLQKVAEQSGATLVVHDAPPGRWSRNDFKSYTLTDALAVINRELEPKGFRVLEKGQYLICISDRSVRKQYRPAVLPPEDQLGRPVRPAADQEPEPRVTQRRFQTIVPAGAEEQEADAQPQLRPNIASHPFNATQADDAERPRPRRPAAAKDAGPPVTVSVRTARGGATSVAKQIHEAFGPQSELVDAGPSGLPAFRVLTLDPADGEPAARQVAFEVEIDTARDELLVTAPRTRATAVAEILRDLDRHAGDASSKVRIAPATAEQLRLAEQLSPVLAQVGPDNGAPPNGGPGPTPGPNGAPMNNGQGPNPNGQGDNPNNARRGPAADIPALVANLRGEVSVEAVQDLGVLILRGNDQDVQAVMDVIRTLENLSAGSQPVVELLRLEHVDSSALSTLLTTVYEQLSRIRNRGEQAPTKIAILPVVKPNAVIIVAPEGEIESVLDLAAELDQPVDPTSEFQVFPLRYAIAEQAATEITTFYEERTGLGARITVTPDIRTNSLIVSARPRDLAEIAQLIRRIDVSESGAVARMRIFPLKSATAEELATVITNAIQSAVNPAAVQTTGQGGAFGAGAAAGAAGGQAAQQLQAARSTVLEFLDASPEGARLLKSGLLSDIRVTADPRTNSLLVVASEPSLPLIEALIRQLDRPASAIAVVKVFTLDNTDASTATELLDQLFNTGQQATGANGQRNAPGIQVAGTTGTGSSLIPLRFAVDVRTNSVVATGSADALRVVESILLVLDESDVRQRETTVIKLKNAPAANVAESIQAFLESQRELYQISENLVSATELLQREVIVVPEPVSNSLLISTTPRFYEQIRRVIAKLDEAPPQVIIQAMLVEVSLDNTDEFGIELGFQDSTLFDRSVGTANDVLQTINVTNTSPNGVQTTTNQILSRSATPGFLFNDTRNNLGNNVGARDPSRLGTQGLSNFSLGRANSDLGYGGFVFSASSANVNVLLRALSAKRTVQILSRPQIRTLDNQIAQVQVGQNVPVVTGVSINALQTTPTITRDNAGLILTVTPRISPDGQVVMEVAAERSEYTGAGVPVFVNAQTGDTVDAPIKDITTARATVSVPTGQTIVLGGIITRNDDTLERKVPYFGDIPYIGQLFRYDSTRTVRRELLIFLTPRVIYNDADSELIKQVEADRLHYIEHEAEKIHGPLYAVPPAGPVMPPDVVPPALPPGAFGPQGVMPDGLPPGTEVVPGLPAEACPPGVYPPGTLFKDDYPPMPGPTPSPSSGPSYPNGAYAPGAPAPLPTPAGPASAPPPEGANTGVTPTGHLVATGRLAGRTEPAATVGKKKGLLSRK